MHAVVEWLATIKAIQKNKSRR